jgi:hypothetical protein
VSFLVSAITGFLNEDTQIMRDQAEFDKEQAEKKRVRLEALEDKKLAFNNELIKKNVAQQDAFSKIYFEGVRDKKLKYNASFEEIIEFNKGRAALGLPTLPLSNLLMPFDKAGDYNTVFGDLKFRNKSNGNVDDATAYLAEVSALGNTSDYGQTLERLKRNNKPMYLNFMSSIDRNVMTINNKLFDSDPTGTTMFDVDIFPGVKNILKYKMGENTPQSAVDDSIAEKHINNFKQTKNENSNTQFMLVSKGTTVGTTRVTPLNFETKAEQDSANKIGNLIGSKINPFHDFVTKQIGLQPDLTIDDKKNIFLASVNMDGSIPDIQGLDPDLALSTITGEKADEIFQKVNNASFKNGKFAILALSPFMKGPTKAKVQKVPGQKRVIAGISKQNYVVTRVFNITQEELGDQAQKFTFKAIEDHRDDNADVIETFNTLIGLVKDQPDNPAIYNLFKQKLKAFVSLDEGILGGVVRDFLGKEGVTGITENASADFGIKDNLTSGYVDLMEERIKNAGDSNAKRIEALKISLAFKMAKADDPSGRLSNQDVEAQYVKLGQITDLKRDALAVLAQTKAQFQKKLDKYNLLVNYGKGLDEATERDYQVIDAVFAYDHLRKESETYRNLIKNRPTQQQNTFEVGSKYKGNRSQNPSGMVFIDPNDETKTPQNIFMVKGENNMPIKIDGKFVYVNEKDIIVDNKNLVARP